MIDITLQLQQGEGDVQALKAAAQSLWFLLESNASAALTDPAGEDERRDGSADGPFGADPEKDPQMILERLMRDRAIKSRDDKEGSQS